MLNINKSEIYAHTSETSSWQTLNEHSLNVAELCRTFVIPQLGSFAYWIGLHHDMGKASERFQQHLHDPSVRTEHSLYGAQEAMKAIQNRFIALLAAQCIIGHHTGLPDTGVEGESSENNTLCARLSRTADPLIPGAKFLPSTPLDERMFLAFLSAICKPKNNSDLVECLAFLTRYCFSALCDADSLDTMRFCSGGTLLPPPHTEFEVCYNMLEGTLSSFQCHTDLQQTRSRLQEQVYRQVDSPGNVFLLNMPTGSGKTLCSMKFALQRAIMRNKKRIIYVSGYNAIIDQTAATLENMFGDSARIVRHQSTFSYDDIPGMEDEDKFSRIHACENWSADMIVSTTVQLFESIAGCGRGKLRRLHNLADSIIILDEIHTLPIAYLQPCLT